MPLERDILSLRHNFIPPFTKLGCNLVNQLVNLVNQEFNITTHHLFIDFKAAYDTIIRVYVGMSELNLPKKLIHPYQTYAHYCDELRQNTKQLFRIL
jgi:hypothetical protein